jgi:hypothetical protein
MEMGESAVGKKIIWQKQSFASIMYFFLHKGRGLEDPRFPFLNTWRVQYAEKP